MGLSPATSTTNSSTGEKPVNKKVADAGTVSQHRVGINEDDYLPDEMVDGVFGAQGADKVNYRAVGWKSTAVLLAKVRLFPSSFSRTTLLPPPLALSPVCALPSVENPSRCGRDRCRFAVVDASGLTKLTFLCIPRRQSQIGLGVLSIPSVFHTLGLVPGILILVFIAGAFSSRRFSFPELTASLHCPSISVQSSPPTLTGMSEDRGSVLYVVLSLSLPTFPSGTDFLFSFQHPTCYSVADCGETMFGRVGREIYGCVAFHSGHSRSFF
jgi:hypothetical protein